MSAIGNPESVSILCLPNEVLFMVLENLSRKDIARAGDTCTCLRKLAEHVLIESIRFPLRWPTIWYQPSSDKSLLPYPDPEFDPKSTRNRPLVYPAWPDGINTYLVNGGHSIHSWFTTEMKIVVKKHNDTWLEPRPRSFLRRFVDINQFHEENGVRPLLSPLTRRGVRCVSIYKLYYPRQPGQQALRGRGPHIHSISDDGDIAIVSDTFCVEKENGFQFVSIEQFWIALERSLRRAVRFPMTCRCCDEWKGDIPQICEALLQISLTV